jgi:peptidoglycan/xylan/chitin deacetylase (PgdA/CDA1 family)
MGRVLTTHGVATGADPARWAFRNIANLDVFHTFLASTPRMAPLRDVLRGRGIALTIDDATRASYDAALLARELGHHVSLFVNPAQVESGDPYWFSLIHLLLDRLPPGEYDFEGVSCGASTRREQLRLRERVKVRCRSMPDEKERSGLILELARRWRVSLDDVPPHLRTLRKEDLVQLRDAGVDLQNHGWSHDDHARLTAKETMREISAGREWLKRELGVDSPYFAVPYGDVLPASAALRSCDSWLTLYDRWPFGRLTSRTFNREELDFGSPAAKPPRWRERVGSRVRYWRARAKRSFA